MTATALHMVSMTMQRVMSSKRSLDIAHPCRLVLHGVRECVSGSRIVDVSDESRVSAGIVHNDPAAVSAR